MDAVEHAAPMMTDTPLPPKGLWRRSRAPSRLTVSSHLESRYASLMRVLGSRWSAMPSVLSLSSWSA
eukprot:2816357-Prymnesium_polylepis.2